jgi:ATP-binding cassette, subfamily C (CFTR/MRP), member 1
MYQFLMYRAIVKIRGALVGIIYRDMLVVRAERGNSSSALSLMSTDVDRICTSARNVIDLVPNIVQASLAIWILSKQLGPVAVAPIIITILCAGAAILLGRILPQRQRKWMASIQKRVGITSEALGSMKGIKMSGLTEPVTKQIQGLRNFELSESERFRRLQISLLSLSN